MSAPSFPSGIHIDGEGDILWECASFHAANPIERVSLIAMDDPSIGGRVYGMAVTPREPAGDMQPIVIVLNQASLLSLAGAAGEAAIVLRYREMGVVLL